MPEKQDLTNQNQAQPVLTFDGIDDCLELSKGFPTIDKAITIEFWAKGENSTTQSTSIIEAHNVQNARVLNIHFPWNNANIFWDAGNEYGFDRIAKEVKIEEYNSWTHWAFVKDATTGKMFIYRSGEIWHQGDGNTRSLAGVNKFVIGCYVHRSNFWKGYLTEFRIWNQARSQEEIKQNINLRLMGNEPGLVGYYPLNGDTNDKTSNGNNTINAAVWKQEELGLKAIEKTSTAPKELPVSKSKTRELVIPNSEMQYIAATGLEDYGRWKTMYQDHKRDPHEKPFRRGRISC